MKAHGIELGNLLRFNQDEGRISLKDYRMVLMSACALGALRRELIETLGWEKARGVLKRFGHAAGLADGHALKQRFPDATMRHHLDFGPALHGLEGVANIVRIAEKTRIDPENGILHIEAYWQNSYEAEQHLSLYGRSEEPVCWTLAGYATGHSSSAVEEQTVVVETECRGMGHDQCRFVLGYANDLLEEASAEQSDYDRLHLPRLLQDFQDRLTQQTKSLKSQGRKITRLENELSQYRHPKDFVGKSQVFGQALETARTVAPVDATVLVLGESGTGKELLARCIHDQSLRRDKPFVPINCSALPDSLQEAELFGYAKGAFTGATVATEGVFEAAHGGTLFLDEIGDLALSAQTKILRAIQEGEIKRLGEAKARTINVRLVAATHQDLRGMVEEKKFRQDLYYRLSVIEITMPPLRDRGVDRLLLAEHFIHVFSKRMKRSVRELSCDAREAIDRYPWPGNVRELQHAMERAVILSRDEWVSFDDLPEEVRGLRTSPAQPRTPSLPVDAKGRQALNALDDPQARIVKALELTRGNRERAANLLGISRTTMWRRMKRYGLL